MLVVSRDKSIVARERGNRSLKRYFADGVLLFVTAVWGTTFVLVQNAVHAMPVFTFLAVRFSAAGFLLLLPALWHPPSRRTLADPRLWKAGFWIGLWLFAGYAFQTLGLLYTTAGKAGFITGLSVALVPLFSLLILRRMPALSAWIGVATAACGLYFLSFGGVAGFNKGDALVLLCAIAFALQIIAVGKYAPTYPALPLAAIQLLTVGALSTVAMVGTNEGTTASFASMGLSAVWSALLICIFLATILAYFAQTAFQKFTTPTRTALIFSMEPVFAAVAAVLWAGERLTALELIGCALILAGMLVAEFGGKERELTSKAGEPI